MSPCGNTCCYSALEILFSSKVWKNLGLCVLQGLHFIILSTRLGVQDLETMKN